MSYSKDEVFDMLYNDEFSKIPYVFRFGKLRIRIVIGLLVMFCAASCIFPVILLAMHIPGGLSALITFASFTAGIAAWMVIALAFEKRAFRKASVLSYRYHVYENERAEERLRKWRLHTLED